MSQTDCIVPSTFLCTAKSCQFLLSFLKFQQLSKGERWETRKRNMYSKTYDCWDLFDIWEAPHGIFGRHLMAPSLLEIQLTDTTGGCGKQTAGIQDPFGMATFQVLLVAICLGWFTPENEGLEIEIDVCKSRLLAGWGSFFLSPFASWKGNASFPISLLRQCLPEVSKSMRLFGITASTENTSQKLRLVFKESCKNLFVLSNKMGRIMACMT